MEFFKVMGDFDVFHENWRIRMELFNGMGGYQWSFL